MLRVCRPRSFTRALTARSSLFILTRRLSSASPSVRSLPAYLSSLRAPDLSFAPLNRRSKTPSNILLLGPPGAGKTVIAREIGKILKFPVFDIDDHHLEAVWGCTVADKLKNLGSHTATALHCAVRCRVMISCVVM